MKRDPSADEVGARVVDAQRRELTESRRFVVVRVGSAMGKSEAMLERLEDHTHGPETTTARPVTYPCDR